MCATSVGRYLIGSHVKLRLYVRECSKARWVCDIFNTFRRLGLRWPCVVDRTLKSNYCYYYYVSSICDTGVISPGVFVQVCFHSQFILSENGVLPFHTFLWCLIVIVLCVIPDACTLLRTLYLIALCDPCCLHVAEDFVPNCFVWPCFTQIILSLI